ncbi:hypothetical protein K1X76_07095 [bacterium]|nr:hypothetical protein [bacterium]
MSRPQTISLRRLDKENACSKEMEPITDRLRRADQDNDNNGEVDAAELGVSDEQFTKAKSAFESVQNQLGMIENRSSCPLNVSDTLRDTAVLLQPNKFLSPVNRPMFKKLQPIEERKTAPQSIPIPISPPKV